MLERGILIQSTILFADIDNFSRWCDTQPPAGIVDSLNSIFEILVNIALKHDGTVDKFLGDGIMVIWMTEANDRGIPAPALALTAAREMIRAIRTLDFSLAVGIATGEVIAGSVGSPKRRDFTVIGKSVNEARLLIEDANGDELVLDKATLDLIDARERLSFAPRSVSNYRGSAFSEILP